MLVCSYKFPSENLLLSIDKSIGGFVIGVCLIVICVGLGMV
jgi:hypothetical protein